MTVVVAQRKVLKMMVGAHAQVIRHPLPDAFGVVVCYVRPGGVEDSDQYNGEGGDLREMVAVSMGQQGPDQVAEPGIELAADDYVVDDDLEWPGRSQSHGALDQHGNENYG